MSKPRCTANVDGGACRKPATTRCVIPTRTGTRVGFRCDAHPIPACAQEDVDGEGGAVRVFPLAAEGIVTTHPAQRAQPPIARADLIRLAI